MKKEMTSRPAASPAGNLIFTMYTVHNDSRVFMTPVVADGSKAGFVTAPAGKAWVFPDEKALIAHLACHTDTHGSADPACWSNDLIPRQFAKGRAARTWTVRHTVMLGRGRSAFPYALEKTENWDYRFHDAAGRTLDVRDLWPAVVAAVRRGDRTEYRPPASGKGKGPGRSRHRGSRYCRRHPSGKPRAGACLRDNCAGWQPDDDDDAPSFRWKPRGKCLEAARDMIDWDYFMDRADRSAGWKARKSRHQWEHRVRDREKHQQNQARKANRRARF